MNVYIKKPEEMYLSPDSFVESEQSNIRYRVNTLLEHKVLIPDYYRLKIMAHKFVENSEDYLLLFEVSATDNLIKIMSLSDLEAMFRIEFEYWVIRHKRPVCSEPAIVGEDSYIKIKTSPIIEIKGLKTFRETERYILETCPTAERVNINDSPFALETNIITLFKIK